MSVSHSAGPAPARAKMGSSMRLSLLRSGDHNGNAFPISSSSSSSSSSSCLGESSPESLRSLSSLSAGRTNSPLDYDMFEVTLMTTVVTETDTTSAVVVTKWLPEEEEESEQIGVDGVLVERIQTEKSESNDNSVSVYLDANSSEYRPETWNENHTLALSLVSNSANNDNVSSASSNQKRHGSSTPDSATEIPEDDDDEQEEALFLSVCSEMDVRRNSSTTLSSSRRTSKDFHKITVYELKDKEDEDTSSHEEERPDSMEENVACILTVNEETNQNVSADDCLQTTPKLPTSKDHSVPANMSTSASSSINPDQPEGERSSLKLKATGMNPTLQSPKAVKNKPNSASKPPCSITVKSPGTDAKSVSKVDLKNVKAKVGSRSAPSSTKTPNQVF